jgi:hypothetical protein
VQRPGQVRTMGAKAKNLDLILKQLGAIEDLWVCSMDVKEGSHWVWQNLQST